MKTENCYIIGMGCIAAQSMNGEAFLEEVHDYSNQIIIKSLGDEIKTYLSPRESRRMSGGIKNSIVSAIISLQEAQLEMPDAIITGSGLGCLQDSAKFLEKLIENEELYLNPTAFIQSSHNTVGGQIALRLGCKAYNFTYVDAATSFQSALIDSMLHLQSGEKKNLLLGGVDEIDDYVATLFQSVGMYKQEAAATQDILTTRTKGAVYGEGAAFYVLSNEKKESSYAEIIDVQTIRHLQEDQIADFITGFLAKNDLSLDTIDLLLLGNNGDEKYDTYYDHLLAVSEHSQPIYFKHLFGDFFTSSSIAMGIAAKILKTQSVPKALFKKGTVKEIEKINHVLVYNQFQGRDHSLMLLKNV